MKIGIIGTGNIGSTAARKACVAGHDVRITNSRGAEGARSLAEDIGAMPMDLEDVVRDVELIILSIPFPALAELPEGLFDNVPVSVPVVDTSNYYPELRDPQIKAVDDGQVESLWVAEQLGRPIIKAFNNILASSFAEKGLPSGWGERVAIAVAGDDEGQKKTVMSLIDEFGFDPVDGGTLAESWRQQPSTPGYCCDYDANTMARGLTQAAKEETPKRRAHLRELFPMLGDRPTHDDLMAMNRFLNPVR